MTHVDIRVTPLPRYDGGNLVATVWAFIDKLGYPADLTTAIEIMEITCVILYVVPQTAILGAVLLTGYLGGAVATHVRIHDNFAGPAIGGVLVWLALFLRDPRARALLPIRRALPSSTESKS